MQSFKGREKARRYAMQALYGWHIANGSLKDIETFYLTDRNPKNFDTEYFGRLLHGIPQNLGAVDNLITPFLDRPFNKLDPIELTILRIAAYEFKYSIDVPFRVVIHEAVELAKVFGAEDSHKFTNSVIDKMAKELRANEVLNWQNQKIAAV
jgi:N utilization substance protein B